VAANVLNIVGGWDPNHELLGNTAHSVTNCTSVQGWGYHSGRRGPGLRRRCLTQSVPEIFTRSERFQRFRGAHVCIPWSSKRAEQKASVIDNSFPDGSTKTAISLLWLNQNRWSTSHSYDFFLEGSCQRYGSFSEACTGNCGSSTPPPPLISQPSASPTPAFSGQQRLLTWEKWLGASTCVAT